MKYLLIDGNNLAIRNSFANAELKNKDNIPTGLHFGFFQSLILLKQKFPDYQFLVSWDGKSLRRQKESKAAVEKRIITSAYKENKKKDEQPKPLLDFYEQAPYLKKAIEQTGIPQVRLLDQETDDLMASYCEKFKKEHEIIIVSSDKDFYQLLDKNVKIFDGMKDLTITVDDFKKEYGIEPKQHIDVGAFEGDSSDNIFGVPSVGNKTAIEWIKEHGSWQNVYVYFHKHYDSLRQQFPDLNEPEFNRLVAIKTKTGKQKYPEIIISLPFTGVTLAVEDKKTGTIPKSILLALMMEERVELAFSLKKMDNDILVPEIIKGLYNKEKIIEYFNYYDIKTLTDGLIYFE
jgi:DNA polymerase-1